MSGEDILINVEEVKKLIYSHPLYPLLASLFERCEQATQITPFDLPGSASESIDKDLEVFIARKEQENGPIFTANQEVNDLMIKAIQVLRIHLLEIEKVRELCQDFCNRYTACLKAKIHPDHIFGDSDNESSDTGEDEILTAASQAIMPIYQMVQTPQGIVAQPIQFSAPQEAMSGNTSVSKMGAVTMSPILQYDHATGRLTEQEEGKGKKSKRGVLPKQATNVMRSWLFQHIVHPYPTEEEKRQIAQQANLTLLQVNNWFINARRRILQPMLETTSPEVSKKKKHLQNKSHQIRHWQENVPVAPGTNQNGSNSSLGNSDANHTATQGYGSVVTDLQGHPVQVLMFPAVDDFASPNPADSSSTNACSVNS